MSWTDADNYTQGAYFRGGLTFGKGLTIQTVQYAIKLLKYYTLTLGLFWVSDHWTKRNQAIIIQS